MNSKETEPKPSYMSTACRVEISTILSLLRGEGQKVTEEMVATATKRGFLPEILFFPQMMTATNLAGLKRLLQEKSIFPPYAFHLPNYFGWKVEDLPTASQCFSNKDFRGALFYLPTRLLISPANADHFCDLIGNLAGAFSPQECLALTVHDFTIGERNRKNALALNKVGNELIDLASEGYPIGIELVFEKGSSPVCYPSVGHTESFLRFCQNHGFGLTIDLCNYAAIVGGNGLPLEDFPLFLRKFVALAKEFAVPIRMIHFNPFNLWDSLAHVAPCDSVYSFPWIKNFLEKVGLEKIPISLEITSNNLGKLDEFGFVPTPQQQMVEKILSRFAN